MKIADVIASEGVGAGRCRDQTAVEQGSVADGVFYHGEPVTPSFRTINETWEAICLQLVLDDGHSAFICDINRAVAQIRRRKATVRSCPRSTRTQDKANCNLSPPRIS